MTSRYAVVTSGVVTNVILWDGVSPWAPPVGSTVQLLPDDSPVFPGYTFDGTTFTAPPAPAPQAPTQAQLVTAYETAIQTALDTYAQSWGYDSLVTAASYAASTVPQFAAEAKALISWRDETWQWAEAYEAQVLAGTLTLPTNAAGLMAAMPPQPTRPAA